MKKKLLLIPLALLLAISLVAIGCPQTEEPTTAPPTTAPPTTQPPPAAPESIKFGCAIALSGWLAPDAEVQVLATKMWVEETNAAGGIYVPEYDKKIPVKLIMYDDKSDPGTTLKMVEKLILDDKIDFLVAPFGTEWHFAILSLTNQYKMPWIGDSITSEEMRVNYFKYPYYFTIETQWPGVGGSMVDLCAELGVKTAVMPFFGTLYGVEGSGYMAPRLELAGIKVLAMRSYPPEVMDLSPMLKEFKALKPDAMIGTHYIADSLILLEQAMQVGLDPKLVYIAYPGAEPPLWEKFGENMEGIFGQGAWNPDDPAAIEFEKRYFDRWGIPTDYLCSPMRWTALEILKQCIEKVGLDHDKIKDMLATETFHTTLWRDVKFENQYNVLGPDISQWQGGKYLPIAPQAWRVTDPIYPKPAWK